MVTVSIFQDGRLLHANRGGRFEFVSLGLPTGTVGNAACFESITIVGRHGRQSVINETAYGGAVSVCIHDAGSRRWIGIASADTVAASSSDRVTD